MQLTLRARGAELSSTFTNDGPAPIALAFWWNRSMRVIDASGKVVVAGAGPVLPCGVAEELEVLAPGATFDRPEPLACTQPAGRAEPIGWSYELAPGTYRVTLIYEAPPSHGFTQHAPDPHAFRGRLESNEVTLTIPVPAKKKRFGLF